MSNPRSGMVDDTSVNTGDGDGEKIYGIIIV